jgi:hypothetical protein
MHLQKIQKIPGGSISPIFNFRISHSPKISSSFKFLVVLVLKLPRRLHFPNFQIQNFPLSPKKFKYRFSSSPTSKYIVMMISFQKTTYHKFTFQDCQKEKALENEFLTKFMSQLIKNSLESNNSVSTYFWLWNIKLRNICSQFSNFPELFLMNAGKWNYNEGIKFLCSNIWTLIPANWIWWNVVN